MATSFTPAQVQEITSQSLYRGKEDEEPQTPSENQDATSDPRLENPHFVNQLRQTQHRVDILSRWNYNFTGKRVFEIGCGQGDCTTVLAELVGENGHVTAVDPGSLDYGSPFTLGQSQAHIKEGRLGSRITFRQADPIDLLSAEDSQYDVAVLSLCTWYFESPQALSDLLLVLLKRTTHVCIAEWALSGATTHVLAALTQAALEAHNPRPVGNIRTIFSPSQIRTAAVKAGWALANNASVTFTPSPELQDGKWEIDPVKDSGFETSMDSHIAHTDENARLRSVILALRDATLASMEAAGGIKNIRAMDVCCIELSTSG